jgi:hypothetical protein
MLWIGIVMPIRIRIRFPAFHIDADPDPNPDPDPIQVLHISEYQELLFIYSQQCQFTLFYDFIYLVSVKGVIIVNIFGGIFYFDIFWIKA